MQVSFYLKGLLNLTLGKNMNFFLLYSLVHWKSHWIRGDKPTITVTSHGVIMTSSCVDI